LHLGGLIEVSGLISDLDRCEALRCHLGGAERSTLPIRIMTGYGTSDARATGRWRPRTAQRLPAARSPPAGWSKASANSSGCREPRRPRKWGMTFWERSSAPSTNGESAAVFPNRRSSGGVAPNAPCLRLPAVAAPLYPAFIVAAWRWLALASMTREGRWRFSTHLAYVTIRTIWFVCAQARIETE
jgi:hypothetical protein